MRMTDAERLLGHLDLGPVWECWESDTFKQPNGYHQFVYAGKKITTHRAAAFAFLPPFPPEWTVDHLCRNRSCANPFHLEPVPHAVNVRRGGNAIKTHCPKGHRYDAENTIRRGDRRFCRACAQARYKYAEG